MPHIPDDCNLDAYQFHLPEELIAQHPAKRRDQSRLLVLDRATGRLRDAVFADLPDLLPPSCCIVANNSRVVPARLIGSKPSGGRVEFLLLTPLPLLERQCRQDGWSTARAEGLLRSSKRLKPGLEVAFGPDLSLTVIDAMDFGRARVELAWRGELSVLLNSLGQVPLPPYIRGGQGESGDTERYQTVYAHPDKAGSVAAPPAGLYFTPELRAQLAAAGHDLAEVTLHVGYGTFSPVRCQDLRQHDMHAEYVEIPESTVQAVAHARTEGRTVLAVGTTTVRALEGAIAQAGRLEPFGGWVNIFITPGFQFQAVDAILTNFHLPGSTLLALVSAFAGRERILEAYGHAVRQGYRFYSYGDAMLII